MDSKCVEICQGKNSQTGQGKNSKPGRGKNLLLTSKEADQADNLFIGGSKILLQWSISLQKVTKDYGKIMAGMLLSMVQTSDK